MFILSSSGVEKRNTKQYKAFQLGEKNKNPVSLYLNKALSLRDHGPLNLHGECSNFRISRYLKLYFIQQCSRQFRDQLHRQLSRENILNKVLST